MNVESMNIAGAQVKSSPKASEQVEAQRRSQETEPEPQRKNILSEDLFSKIKELTENGSYSVRFENDRDLNELVVKVVDRKTDEVIRQIPPEELLDLTKRLDDLRGNLVDMQG